MPMARREREARSKPREVRVPSSPSEQIIFAPSRNLSISEMNVDFCIISLQPHRIRLKIRSWHTIPDDNRSYKSLARRLMPDKRALAVLFSFLIPRHPNLMRSRSVLYWLAHID